MKVVKTAKCLITSHNKIFDQTLSIYRDALGFIVNVVDNEWENISVLASSKEKFNHVEKLVHETKDNPDPKYTDFDRLFFKFPSYFRRSAIAEAIGIVSSYRSNLANYYTKKIQYESEDKILKDMPPVLSLDHFSFPVFYKGNMFKKLDDKQAMIKIFKDGDWKWITISYKNKNLNNRNLDSFKECNPALVRKNDKYYLHIPFEKSVQLKDKEVEDRTIIAVDLGLTNSAVCSAMKADGTVIDRLFINQPVEKDRMLHRLGRLKKTQKHSCTNSKNKLPNHWRKIDNLQKQIVQDTANKIVNFAQDHDADVIVFEYLGKFKKTRGESSYAKLHRQKMQFWAKRRVQEKVKNKAHNLGMRFSRVSPVNTSALAFDGSGFVTRNKKKDLCIFSTGKTYHSDLNASYNIGARYFIREYQKTFSEKKRSVVQAKVPELQKRTSCTLASLISLTKVI